MDFPRRGRQTDRLTSAPFQTLTATYFLLKPLFQPTRRLFANIKSKNIKQQHIFNIGPWKLTVISGKLVVHGIPHKVVFGNHEKKNLISAGNVLLVRFALHSFIDELDSADCGQAFVGRRMSTTPVYGWSTTLTLLIE